MGSVASVVLVLVGFGIFFSAVAAFVQLRRTGTGFLVMSTTRAAAIGLAVSLGVCTAGGAIAPKHAANTIDEGSEPTRRPSATEETTTTAAPPGDDAPLVVAAGDIACRVGMVPEPGQCQQAATSALIGSMHPVAVLALGDLQYERGETANFESSYDSSWGRFKDITHPAAGNHDWGTPNASGYRGYFPGAIADGRTYYSFDVANWHLIALDSNCGRVGGCQANSPQERWLRADLAAHPARCTLAYWHHPRWSSGYHHSDEDYEAFWQALAGAGADVVLGGHDHHYERFAPDRGIRQFVVGTGGRSLYPVFGLEPRSEVNDSNTFGVLALRLGERSYSWRFVPAAGGRFSDEGSAAC